MFEEVLGSEIGSELGSVIRISCFFSDSSCLSLQQDNRVGFSQDNKTQYGYNGNLADDLLVNNVFRKFILPGKKKKKKTHSN